MGKLDPDVLWKGLVCLVSYSQLTGAGSRPRPAVTSAPYGATSILAHPQSQTQFHQRYFIWLSLQGLLFGSPQLSV